MDIMDSSLCRLRCAGGTEEEIATANEIYVPRTQETDLGKNT